MPLEKWLAAEKYDEADRKVAPVVRFPKKRDGATRRDLTIDDVERDGRLYWIEVTWNDAQDGEAVNSKLSATEQEFEQMLRDLGASEVNDILYRRVLGDFHIAPDGTETDKWHRYPDAANDNLVRENDDEDAMRTLLWSEVA